MRWKQFWSRLLFRPNSWARDFRIQHPSTSFGCRLIFWPQFWSGNLRIPHPFAFLEAGYFSDRNSDREILEFCIIICSFFFNNDISLVNIIPIRIPVKNATAERISLHYEMLQNYVNYDVQNQTEYRFFPKFPWTDFNLLSRILLQWQNVPVTLKKGNSTKGIKEYLMNVAMKMVAIGIVKQLNKILTIPTSGSNML